VLFAARRLLLLLLPLAVIVAGAAAPAPSAASKRYALRYIFRSDSAPSAPRAAVAAGWNLLDVNSKERADALPAGSRGLMWLGDYDNKKCDWQRSNDDLARRLAGTKDDPKVAGFLFSDEPDPFACPSAPAQHRARSRLIHALTGGKLTVISVDSNSREQTIEQIPRWAGAADRLALDPYPCYRGKPCNYAWIRTVIHAADAAHLHYWGVVQAFADDTWRWPTVAEEKRMLSIWTASKASAVSTFAWSWGGHDLSSRPALLQVWRRFNGVKASKHVAAAARVRAPTADEIHFTFTSRTAVTFDWRGTAKSIRVRVHGNRWKTFAAHQASPHPYSSSGPFEEARVGGLAPGKVYRYTIGGSGSSFRTVPTGSFRFDVEADIGDSRTYPNVATTQAQIAADKPAFVVVPGDLTYANDHGQAAVDQHFRDVMVWSRKVAYMPAWGNHEWDESTDNLSNYKGRFAIPHPHASPGAPTAGCCGEDWGWFDAGPVRFISYPEPYTSASWAQWKVDASKIFASAQSNRKIRFIITFGHRPAYSTGHHHGDSDLAGILDGFGDRYSKYVLNLNGHSHNYERFVPIHHVVHVTAAGGGASLEGLSGNDSRSAFRALHLIHVRISVTPRSLKLEAICGPPTSSDGFHCTQGRVVDTATIAPR
jgi:hypothetical protein